MKKGGEIFIMKSEIQPYDIVILGFDDTAEETVEVLQAQGKRALYIPINPQMMITLMSQKQNGLSSNEIDTTISHINVHHHEMDTPLNQTTTYYLQPEIHLTEEEYEQVKIIEDEVEDMPTPFYYGGLKERVVLGVAGSLEDYEAFRTETLPKQTSLKESEKQIEIESELDNEDTHLESQIAEETITQAEMIEDLEALEADEVEELEVIDLEEEDTHQEEQEPNVSNEIEENIETIDQEQLEQLEEVEELEEELEEVIASSVEKPFSIITPLAKECSLIDNRLLGIRESSYRDRLKNTEALLSSYHLFNPIRIEEEEPSLDEEFDNTIEAEELNYQDFIDIPDEALQESKSEGDFEFNLELNQTEEQEEIEEIEAETIEASTIETKPHMMDHDLRLRKKLSFQNRHQNPKPTSEPIQMEQLKPTNIEPEEQEQEQEQEQTKLPEGFSLEPFSSRRRNKKSRLFSSLENPIPRQAEQVPSKSDASKSELNFSDIIQESLVTNRENSTEAEEPIEAVELKRETLDDTTNDTLKSDNIEFEEPYGYSSFEDFFPSFSGNDRKRQELDKIEKRKIALRGLHNLINNLG